MALKEILTEIERRQRFLLTSHARPDGDAIGSALACGQILRLMGKEADVVLRDGVPRIYQPLPFADASFDAVSMNYGLLHLDRPEQALAEFRRIQRATASCRCLVFIVTCSR